MTPERWKRIRSAIEAALEASSPERREAALIEACADDATLLSEARSILRVARSLHLFKMTQIASTSSVAASRIRVKRSNHIAR